MIVLGVIFRGPRCQCLSVFVITKGEGGLVSERSIKLGTLKSDLVDERSAKMGSCRSDL